MNLIFLGPPGAGKGTIAKKFQDKWNIPQISTGDLFRKAIADGTELGNKVKQILTEGNLVPDDVTIELVKNRLADKDTENGFILDGFPRTIAQAEGLETFAEIDAVINFQIAENEIIRRLSGRRIAKKSGRIYHIEYNPPKIPGKCDETGEELIIRPDDREDAVRHRLEVYERETAPLIDFYSKKGKLHDIDASAKPDEVLTALEKVVLPSKG